jgi:hypothetical protein
LLSPWCGLQLSDRVPDPRPDDFLVVVAAFEHLISPFGSHEFSPTTLPLDQQIGGLPYVAIGRYRRSPPALSGYVAADLGRLRRLEPGCVADPVWGTAFISADVPRIRPRPSCFAIVERRSE